MENTSKTPSILITGATGTVGSELAGQLAARNIPFRAMVRSVEKAREINALASADLVKADFNDPQSLAVALKGIEKVFLLTNSTANAEAQQKALVTASLDSNVKHIVKLSQFAADLHSPVRYLRYHAAVEQAIIDSGIAYTFLRPNLFMQGLLLFRDSIISLGKFFAPAGNAQVSLVDVRDIAAVALQALTEPGHEGNIYDITGPEALTHNDIARLLSEATGRAIQYNDVSTDEMRQALAAVGFPEWQAEGLLEDYAHYVRGEAAVISPAVLEVTGCAPHDFEHFAKDHAHLFA